MPTYFTIPPHVTTALLQAHPTTRAELELIRDRRDPSRYSGVYAHVHGGRYKVKAYRARVLKFYELGSGFESPEDAARAIVAFYKAYFGEKWANAFRFRKVTPWRLRRLRNGYAAEVYVRGHPNGVTHADAHGRGKGASERWTWQTPCAAKQAVRAAMRRWFQREVRKLVVPHPGLMFWRG
jgi:hypothetical protein